MMVNNSNSTLHIPEKGRDTAKTVRAAGGLLAAFGVASCCALPIALSLLGISAITERWHLSVGRHELARALAPQMGDAHENR